MTPPLKAPDVLADYDPDNCKDDPDHEDDFVFGWYCV